MLTPAGEIYFWAGIMRDHAEFQLIALSSRESYFIQRAQWFKDAFAAIGQEAERIKNMPVCSGLSDLINRTICVLSDFINFKRIIARRLLECNIEISFPPTFINHMINEAMDFFRVLNTFREGANVNVAAENIYLHKIWLRDASGHASAVACELDPAEGALIKEAERYKKCFDCLYLKAIELEQLLERTCLADGTLERLNEEAEKLMYDFIEFLAKAEALRKKCKVMGTMKPLMADHMIREEKYYLWKIRELKALKCDNSLKHY